MNPANLLTSSDALPAPGLLEAMGNAIAAQPVMAAAGFCGVAAILGAFAYQIMQSNRTLRATKAAHAATERATAAVRTPGKLADVRPAADRAMARAEDTLSTSVASAKAETNEVLMRLRMHRLADVLPLPEVYEPTRPAPFRG